VYARDGRIPIDNNRVELLMREVTLSRKNWLFVSNVETGYFQMLPDIWMQTHHEAVCMYREAESQYTAERN